MTDGSSAADNARVDDRLMAQIKAGSLDAFCELYDRHWPGARDLAADVGDPDLADAIVRDAFASIWDRREGYRIEGGIVAGWIHAAVQARVMQVGAEDATSVTLASAGWPVGAEPSTAGEGERMVGRAEARRSEARRIGALLDGLPHVQRQVIALAFYGGMSHPEIAEHLGLPNDTVKGRMRLGLQKLLIENEQQQA